MFFQYFRLIFMKNHLIDHDWILISHRMVLLNSEKEALNIINERILFSRSRRDCFLPHKWPLRPSKWVRSVAFKSGVKIRPCTIQSSLLRLIILFNKKHTRTRSWSLWFSILESCTTGKSSRSTVFVFSQWVMTVFIDNLHCLVLAWAEILKSS